METDRDASRKRVLIVVGALVVIVAIVLGVVALTRGDGKTAATTTTTSTSSTSSTSSTTSTSLAPTTTVSAADLDSIVFPDLTQQARFSDPVGLTQAFALQVLGFDSSLVLGPFTASDASGTAGEVTVSASATGSPTTVNVRQVANGSWGVMSARTDSIRLDTPIGGTRISSPQPLLGAAYAFEGRVNVMLYADGSEAPIATTFVMGRGDGVLGDFSGQLTFTAPKGATRGVLVLSSAGGKNGASVGATAIRVKF